jgi:hypothetical protein
LVCIYGRADKFKCARFRNAHLLSIGQGQYVTKTD